MKPILLLLPLRIASLSAPLSRRNAIGGSLAAAAAPGASTAAAPSAPIAYDDVVLDLPCGAKVPACVWLPSAGTDAPPARYKYRISAGRLVKTILRLPTPDAIARTFDLAAAPGGEYTPGATVPAGTPVIVVAHGFLGTRFDLSMFAEAIARAGAVAIAPDFDENLAGSYAPDPDGGSSRDRIVVAALEHAKGRGATGAVGGLGHSAGAFTALNVPNAKGAVAIAGFGRDTGVPFLAIVSEGDGAVPLRFVRERFPKDVAPIDIGALPAAWPRRGVIAFSGENAPCHVSFLAPDVNDEMQNFLGPLLPVARFLGIPVLDFDKYGLLLDADATAETCMPAATAFLTQYVIKG